MKGKTPLRSLSDSRSVTSSVPAPLSAGQEIKISHSGVGHLLLCQNLRTDPCAAWPLLREAEWHFTGCTPNV